MEDVGRAVENLFDNTAEDVASGQLSLVETVLAASECLIVAGALLVEHSASASHSVTQHMVELLFSPTLALKLENDEAPNLEQLLLRKMTRLYTLGS